MKDICSIFKFLIAVVGGLIGFIILALTVLTFILVI